MNDKTTEPIEPSGPVLKIYKKRSMLGEVFYNLRKNVGAMIGLGIICFMILMAVFSILFISWDSVTTTNVTARFTPPGREYLFGTDSYGRNMLLRIVYGTRYSLIIGFVTIGISSIIGSTIGSFAAYYGRSTDNIIMRIIDIISSIPGLLLGLVIVSVLGQSLRNLIIAVTIAYIPSFTRISRASILTVKNHEFVEAARATGLSRTRIIFTQVLPNGLSPIIVQITVNLGQAIIMAASLSFMGYGVPVPAPEWGGLISTGREFARNAPWLMAFPGVFVMLIVLALNQLGDGLRDALDPKMKRR